VLYQAGTNLFAIEELLGHSWTGSGTCGMVISAGKMSGLWSGNPNAVRLDEWTSSARLVEERGDGLFDQVCRVGRDGFSGGQVAAHRRVGQIHQRDQ